MTAFTAKVVAARAAAGLSRRTRAGGGTTLPGKLLLRMAPDAIERMTARLAGGSVVISATNGKTTTAKMLAALLEPERRLCRNTAGANLESGVASALLHCHGADLGVFEVDEGALPGVATRLEPRATVLGNLFRDQLDRYGELEAIAARWQRMTAALPAGSLLVRNGDDPLVASLSNPGETLTFGIDHEGAALAEMPHASDSKWCPACGTRLRYERVYLGHLGDWSCPGCGRRRPPLDVWADALDPLGLDGTRFVLRTPLGDADVELPLPGLYNVYNALAAAAAACAVGGVDVARMAQGLERFDAAFGRFERLRIGDRDAVLLLAKNPAGANELIRTLATDSRPKQLLVALNDRIADGRDVSWIWDVDFELLAGQVQGVVTAGTRAAEMAMRLKYGGVGGDRLEVAGSIEAGLDRALAGGEGPVYLLGTYTAMLELRAVLTRRGVVRPYWEAA
ncbi:MAG TPA: MurT ligase domain-containing protein [Gaiellales bacterium]|nr:MurT ligase domain-containing protein [Gaiellales bacterium]